MTTVLLVWGKPVAPADHPHVNIFHETAFDFLHSLLPPPLPAPAPGWQPPSFPL
jgi:hypothetical protein